MSTTATVACDGDCGQTHDQRCTNGRAALPIGWLRLHVTGRALAAPDASNLAVLDVCSPQCAAIALVESSARCAP